ncbi:hypothetical protein CEJ87_12155 [Caldifermentibacillus hisashii]|nr:hypothetical protein CEJ87_12155 [Caldifermentibacillus hisashii]
MATRPFLVDFFRQGTLFLATKPFFMNPLQFVSFVKIILFCPIFFEKIKKLPIQTYLFLHKLNCKHKEVR